MDGGRMQRVPPARHHYVFWFGTVPMHTPGSSVFSAVHHGPMCGFSGGRDGDAPRVHYVGFTRNGLRVQVSPRLEAELQSLLLIHISKVGEHNTWPVTSTPPPQPGRVPMLAPTPLLASAIRDATRQRVLASDWRRHRGPIRQKKVIAILSLGLARRASSGQA
eukprot:scaffold10428_cov128-Isochrysis_galbana.AAC.2